MENGNFFYYKYLHKRALKIEMLNTAYGIKSFAILQLLNKNKFFNHKTLLVLDEPEIHLHPKWQLKMAEVIVQLCKSGIKVLVNSHSPYMIEALQRYAKKSLPQSSINFYIAENNTIAKIDNSNEATLQKVFQTLSEPFETFTQFDLENL